MIQDKFKLALAGPAQKQARDAADHINRINNSHLVATLAHPASKVFDLNAASTGLTEEFDRVC